MQKRIPTYNNRLTITDEVARKRSVRLLSKDEIKEIIDMLKLSGRQIKTYTEITTHLIEEKKKQKN